MICAAACFYLYMRISFIERKGSMMESVIVDLRVAIDNLMSSGMGGGGSPIPISPPPPPHHLSAPVSLESSESENIPEESFYSSVLEQAHEEAVEELQPLTGISLEKAMEGLSEVEASTEPELDVMTKADLMALAEKRGLRAKKSSSREQVLALLRRSAPLQNSASTTGTENVSGSTGPVASLDGTAHVDLGQGAALD